MDGQKVNSFTITPSAGYFVIDKLSVGLDLGFTSTTTKYDDAKSTNNTFAILPTATYYFTDNTVIKPYLGAGIGYSSITEKEEYRGRTNETTFDGFAWKVKGGFVYFFTPSIAADLGLSYSQFSSKNSGVTTNVNSFGVGVGLSVFFKQEIYYNKYIKACIAGFYIYFSFSSINLAVCEVLFLSVLQEFLQIQFHHHIYLLPPISIIQSAHLIISG